MDFVSLFWLTWDHMEVKFQISVTVQYQELQNVKFLEKCCP